MQELTPATYWIADQVTDLNSYLNIPNKMTVVQIAETARLIHKRHPRITPDQLAEALDTIRAGEVSLYNSIDGAKILAAMNNYIRNVTTKIKHLTGSEPISSQGYLNLLFSKWSEQEPESYQRFMHYVKQRANQSNIANMIQNKNQS